MANHDSLELCLQVLAGQVRGTVAHGLAFHSDAILLKVSKRSEVDLSSGVQNFAN